MKKSPSRRSGIFRAVFCMLCLGVLGMSSAQPDKLKKRKQRKYLPKALTIRDGYIGVDKAQLFETFPKAREVEMTSDFREIVKLGPLDPPIKVAYAYVEIEGDEKSVYEYVLVIEDSTDPLELAREYWGAPNTEDGEWHFKPEDTGLKFQLAGWTFENKIIIAANLPGSEWQSGF
ncbi:hypothetical protein [Pontibacter sp. G13]|uniref:hypothetical protein n=1 Tax=Pontibacter sp. G13 TaxID=3074898 RepID=UPI00288A88DE|nr:hypothetical protein [Pontibacter sp. G13]WNJ17095.1 hypothetical protein RJD25_19750 [Pontibacter sp. G13]